jgi:hypothetical protein
MARYRAGYEDDYGLRDFGSHRPRHDVGSRGYDRGYLHGGQRGAFERPWVGGYREGYQGGSGGIGVNTSGTGSAWVRGEGGAGTRGYGLDYGRGRERGGRARGYREGGGRGPGLNTGGRFDRGDQGYAGGGGEYSGRYVRGGYDRGYDGGWLNRGNRWF